MQITGKFIKAVDDTTTSGMVTIELPPIKVDDLKAGDEVWIKIKIFDKHLLDPDTIVAHFPQQPKEE